MAIRGIRYFRPATAVPTKSNAPKAVKLGGCGINLLMKATTKIKLKKIVFLCFKLSIVLEFVLTVKLQNYLQYVCYESDKRQK